MLLRGENDSKQSDEFQAIAKKHQPDFDEGRGPEKKHKRMYLFAKDTFVSKKRRVKENKAKAKKRRRERGREKL